MIGISLEIYTEKSKRKLATRWNTYFVTLIDIVQSYSWIFDVCVTVHHRYNNINNLLDVTMIVY